MKFNAAKHIHKPKASEDLQKQKKKFNSQQRKNCDRDINKQKKNTEILSVAIK